VPRTPDEFPGINQAEGILFIEDGYGLPGTKREVRYSDGYFYALDEYGVFNVRTYVHPHIYSHTAGGTDSFYVVSQTSPTPYEDINDGYDVGWRWINIADAYEYVCIDNTANAAVWVNTTGGGGGGGPPQPHVETHLGGGSDTFYVISPGTPGAYQDINDGYEVGFRWIRTDGYEYVCLDNTIGAAVWKLTTSEPCPGAASIYFDAYDTIGGTNISSGWTDVPLDGERIKDSAFSHTGSSAEVTINTAGTYLVIGRVGTDVTSGTSRSESGMRIMLDTGNGYSEIPGSRGVMYNRITSQGGTHAAVSMILSLNVGDKLKMQAQRYSGTNTIILRENNSGLVIVAPGGGGGDDELVKVSSNDIVAGYLEDKIVDGYGIDIEVFNDGGNEQLEISLKKATCCGQVLYATDGENFTPELPLTSCGGWLINDSGILLIVG
jgi:hypothetical protein